MSSLGEILKNLRGKESLRDAADRIGISHTYLRILEKGVDLRSGNPVKVTADTLKLISDAYNYPYNQLLRAADIIDDETRDELIEESKMKIAEEIINLPEDKRKIIEDLLRTFKNN
ncbi:helix-turn-helix domain-containing protein [Paenibacillus sp. FSL R7-0128]|jgi:transcriptional regulator with XRE-family HTH domain|uniref:helix-turn-helix domain-containing protein n=1 Tax=Paenibacillus sp. FSL R7-0128 TaxID=2954529 RepID=UPI0030F91A2E